MSALKLQSDDERLEKHLEELVERYAGRAVAVYKGKASTTACGSFTGTK
jgi:hypothetical protein